MPVGAKGLNLGLYYGRVLGKGQIVVGNHNDSVRSGYPPTQQVRTIIAVALFVAMYTLGQKTRIGRRVSPGSRITYRPLEHHFSFAHWRLWLMRDALIGTEVHDLYEQESCKSDQEGLCEEKWYHHERCGRNSLPPTR
jgi:hypothetical protein